MGTRGLFSRAAGGLIAAVLLVLTLVFLAPVAAAAPP
jgi:hypothetical protein